MQEHRAPMLSRNAAVSWTMAAHVSPERSSPHGCRTVPTKLWAERSRCRDRYQGELDLCREPTVHSIRK